MPDDTPFPLGENPPLPIAEVFLALLLLEWAGELALGMPEKPKLKSPPLLAGLNFGTFTLSIRLGLISREPSRSSAWFCTGSGFFEGPILKPKS